MNRIAILAILADVALLSGCQAPDSLHGPQWSYSGETGPEHWDELNPDWQIAEIGHEQSPIDIRTDETRSAALPSVDFHYEPTHVEFINNGHTIELEYDEGSYIEVDGTRHKLIQLHLHAPSEHTINGRQAQLEMHLVHRDDRGHLAVVGLLIVEGPRNEAIVAAWDHLPKQPGERVSVPDAFVNADEIIPKNRRYYRYAGSLTTPPCTEGVTWLVLQELIQMSREQIAEFTTLYPECNRPVQPLYDRRVVSGE